MTGRWMRWAAVAAVVAAGGWALIHFGFGRPREWTTRSPAALAAFQAGLDAEMRLYNMEAVASFRFRVR